MKDLLKYLKIQKSGSGETLANWRHWACNLLRRRHITVEPSVCAYDKIHLVGKVQSFGGGSLFWSKACSGCELGKLLISTYETFKKVPQDAHCALLASGLLTRDKVKVGQVYHLPARQSD